MNVPGRLGVFAVALGLAFAAATAVGQVVGPVVAAPAGHADGADDRTGGTHGADTHGTPVARGAGADTPTGLQVSEGGYTLVPDAAALPASGGPYRFRIVGPDGRALTRYTPTHDRDLHLIVVRRDLAGFAHLHPTRGADGVWSVPLRPAAGAGSYRVFADFAPAGGDPLVLGVDLAVAGDYRPRPLPAPDRTTTVGPYTVTVAGTLRAGASSPLTLSVAEAGRPVTDLEPYLAAYGHLVALRAGDLAYLHVHPDGQPGDGTTRAGPGVAFSVEVPTAGAYRLFLDFKHRGVVRTAAVTMTAGAG